MVSYPRCQRVRNALACKAPLSVIGGAEHFKAAWPSRLRFGQTTFHLSNSIFLLE